MPPDDPITKGTHHPPRPEFKIRDRATGNIVTMGELDSATVDKDGFLVHPNNPAGVDKTGNVVFMQGKPTEAELVQALREEFAVHAAGICSVMDQARAAGFRLEFGFMPDSFGRYQPPTLTIMKAL